MTTPEQAESTARNTLELAQARRRLTAVQHLAEPYLDQPDGYQHYAVVIDDEVHLAALVDDLRDALATPPAPHILDPEEVPT